jgi:type II secretory pathway pseudopilin PulG
VILGILLAIAIPALTGYIQKAQDESYIADAKTMITALRTLMLEGYAEGAFNDPAGAAYVVSGNKFTYPYPAKPHKIWEHGMGGFLGYSDAELKQALSELPGIDYTTGLTLWWSAIVGSNSPDTTLLNADGFVWSAYPNGYFGNGSPLVFVTYKMERLPLADDKYSSFNYQGYFSGRLVYNADAGYEIYHVIVN